LKLHLDGARLFNALIATGDKAKDYGQYFDGISICLSKGLGAPVGSVLLASKETIKKARKIRKVLGGGMRQAGFLAAAGIYALDHHVERLKTDHAHAKVIAKTLSELSWVNAVMPVETNIIIFQVKPKYEAVEVVRKLTEKGILCNTTNRDTIRFVTHLDISTEMVDRAIEILLHLYP